MDGGFVMSVDSIASVGGLVALTMVVESTNGSWATIIAKLISGLGWSSAGIGEIITSAANATVLNNRNKYIPSIIKKMDGDSKRDFCKNSEKKAKLN